MTLIYRSFLRTYDIVVIVATVVVAVVIVAVVVVVRPPRCTTLATRSVIFFVDGCMLRFDVVNTTVKLGLTTATCVCYVTVSYLCTAFMLTVF